MLEDIEISVCFEFSKKTIFSQYTADYIQHTLKGELKYQKRQDNEEAHYCHLCEIEVFNILFVKEMNNKFRVFCLQCARRGGFDEYVFLQQTKFKELAVIFDQFQLHPVSFSKFGL